MRVRLPIFDHLYVSESRRVTLRPNVHLSTILHENRLDSLPPYEHASDVTISAQFSYSIIVRDDDPTGLDYAKREAGKALSRALYGELVDELFSLIDEAHDLGLPRNYIQKIERVVQLAAGDAVEDRATAYTKY